MTINSSNTNMSDLKANDWLLQFSKNITSTTGEDGILEKIFEIIPNSKRWCVELGAGNGRIFSNSYDLIVNKGWSSVQIEGDPIKYEELIATHGENYQVTCLNKYVTFSGTNTLDNLFKKTSLPHNFDLLSIDIDGNDYYLWESLEHFRPKVIVIEFNPSIPNQVDWVQEKNMEVNHGCSLLSLINLGKRKGYELISATWLNGIFVDSQYYELFGIEDNSIWQLYRDPQNFQTFIFQTYDGTILLAGNDKLLWHDRQFNFEEIQEKIQVLPEKERVFPAKIAVDSSSKTGKTDADISVILFSKDRPLQLQAYLESLFYYSSIKEDAIYVLYQPTQSISYQELIRKNPNIHWVEETNFTADLITIINEAKDFILWGCDDVFFKSFFDLNICIKALTQDPKIFGFALRLGENIQPNVEMISRGDYLLCDWTKAPQGYWSYPWEVSASIYRKSDVMEFIKLSSNISNPNYLEGKLAGYFEQNKDSTNKKYLACFELSKAITLTINRVQETYPNWFDGTNETDINTLYQNFLQGYKLNWTKFKECGNSLVHVRSEYFEIEAPVTTGKIVDDINSPEKSISITDYLTQGNELLEAGQIQEAIASFQKAVESNPSSPWPYYYLGLALDKDGQFQGSVSQFGRAIGLDPDLIWAHHYLGETLVKLGRLEEAVEKFQRAIELKPDLSWSYYHLGEALCKLGRWDEAVVNLRLAIELNPDFGWSHHFLGEALSQLQKWEEAAVALSKAVTLHQHFSSYSALGQCWEKLGELKKATVAFQKGIELAAYNNELQSNLINSTKKKVDIDHRLLADNYHLLAESLLKQKDLDETKSQLQQLEAELTKAKKISEKSIGYYRWAVESHPEAIETKEEWEQAIAALRQAVELAPESGHDHYLLGLALTRICQEEDANPTFRRAGELLEQQGKLELAIAAYQKALQSSSDSDLSFKLGMIHAQCGQFPEALTQYQQALQNQPKEPEKYAKLAVILVQQGLGEQVITCYHQVFQNKSETAKHYYNLGLIFSQQGLADAAVACFRQAPQKHPSEQEVYDSIWRGLNQLGPLTEDNHYYPAEINPELTEAHFNHTSQYKVLLFNNLTDDEKNWLEQAGFSLAYLETMSKDDISLEELYINGFADCDEIKLSRKYLTRTFNAYQSMVQTGYIYTLCPMTGTIVRSNQSFHIHYYGDFQNFIYRFVSQEVFYLIIGHWGGIKLSLYVPSKDLVIWFYKDTWVGEHIVNKLKAFMVSNWQKVKSYISSTERKPVAVTYGHISNISHYLWNEVTGIQYLAINNSLEKVDIFLVQPYDYYNIGEMFSVSKNKIVDIANNTHLSQEILDNNYFAMRVTDNWVTEELAQRIYNHSLVLCSKNQTLLLHLEESRKCFPLIWLTIRTHRRVWLSQVEGFASIINEIYQSYPNLGIVFDGWGIMGNYREDPRDVCMIDQENQVVTQIKNLISSEIPTYNIIGLTNFDKAVWANNIDMYIQPEGTGLTHVTWISNKPGVIFSHKQAMGQKWHWFSYRENAIEPVLIKDEYLIGSAQDRNLHHHENFDCNWQGIYIEALTIIKQLKKD